MPFLSSELFPHSAPQHGQDEDDRDGDDDDDGDNDDEEDDGDGEDVVKDDGVSRRLKDS